MAPTKKTAKRGVKVPAKGLTITKAGDYSDLLWYECQMRNIGAKDIADKATELGCPVGAQTVANHITGNVQNPQLRTVVAVLRALGFEVRVGSFK